MLARNRSDGSELTIVLAPAFAARSRLIAIAKTLVGPAAEGQSILGVVSRFLRN